MSRDFDIVFQRFPMIWHRIRGPGFFISPYVSKGYVKRPTSVQMSPLRKGGDFLSTSEDGRILVSQSLYPLTTTGLAHLYNHKIVTPTIAGISLDLDLTPLTGESLPIELENLLTLNGGIHPIGNSRLVRDSDSHEDHASLTFCIFNDFELSSHFYILG